MTIIIFYIIIDIKDPCYVWSKNSKNQQLLDILAYNSANKPSLAEAKWYTKVSWIIGPNVQKLLICAASILKMLYLIVSVSDFYDILNQ